MRMNLGAVLVATAVFVSLAQPIAAGADEPQAPDATVQQWRTHDLVFQSSLSSELLGGTESTFEIAAVPKAWRGFGGGRLDITTEHAHGGSSALRLSDRAQSHFSPRVNIYDMVKAQGPGKYNLEFWVYVDGGQGGDGRVVVRGDRAEQYSFFAAGASYATASGLIATTSGEWTRYQGSVTVAAADLTGTSGTMDLMLDSLPGAVGQTLLVDDVRVTKDHYADPFSDVDVDVHFTAPDGTNMTLPAFWDGGDTWRARFAPTQLGTWRYTTVASNAADTGLNGQSGTITSVPYTGDLTLYRHGLVRTDESASHFVYADGTPFLYVGDTHWSMPEEPYDAMFTTLVDDRVAKGFTVYQSEPLGAGYNLADGLNEADVARFQNIDRRFQYIADAGLVHANSQLFFASVLTDAASYPPELLNKLTRYWVARYAAYPVLWTTAQESDKNLYGKFTSETNPWKSVFAALHQYDPYAHPLTVHQENTSSVRASDSVFKDLPGYSWFGAQWAPRKNGQLDFTVGQDYHANSTGRPAINYEGHYENLWTNGFGARMQGWTSFLNGFAGYGYGAQDIWQYNGSYDEETDSTIFGITITAAMKQVTWEQSKDLATSTEVGTYLTRFLRDADWSNLEPRFDDSAWFHNDESWYSVATAGNDTYAAYFYNPTTKTGTLGNLDDSAYHARWYNPREGTYATIGDVVPTGGQWVIPAKPDTADWALLLTKNPLPAWDEAATYDHGNQVSYQGRTWVAQWWTRNEAPGSTATGSWMELGEIMVGAGAQVRLWTSTWAYQAGATVVYDGLSWRAAWWTRNQRPGDPNGPWRPVAGDEYESE